MKKKRIVAISSIIVVLAMGIMIVVFTMPGRALTIVSKDKVKRIDIINGNTGNITTVEGDDTPDILDKLHTVSGERKKVPASTGWLYTITLYGDTSVLESIEMVSAELWKKDGTYYSIKNGEAVIEALIQCEK